MALPTNPDVQRAFSLICGPLTEIDDNWATLAGSQAGATHARGQVFVITQSITAGGVTLPILSTNEAPPLMVIVNNSPNTIRVGCGNATDTINGTVTSSNMGTGTVNLATQSSLICVASQSPFGIGGGPTASPNNWHTAVLT